MARSGKSSAPSKYKKKDEWQHFFQGNKKTLLLLFQCDTVKNNAPIVSQNWKTFELQRYVLTLHI